MTPTRIAYWSITALTVLAVIMEAAGLSSGRVDAMGFLLRLVEMALACGLALSLNGRTHLGALHRALLLLVSAAFYFLAIRGGLIWSNLTPLAIGALALVPFADLLRRALHTSARDPSHAA